jgi:hypothetical protein
MFFLNNGSLWPDGVTIRKTAFAYVYACIGKYFLNIILKKYSTTKAEIYMKVVICNSFVESIAPVAWGLYMYVVKLN